MSISNLEVEKWSNKSYEYLITAVVYGSALVASYTQTFESKEKACNFEAKIQASMEAIDVDGSASSDSSESKFLDTITIDLSSFGYNFEDHNMLTFKDLKKFVSSDNHSKCVDVPIAFIAESVDHVLEKYQIKHSFSRLDEFHKNKRDERIYRLFSRVEEFDNETKDFTKIKEYLKDLLEKSSKRELTDDGVDKYLEKLEKEFNKNQ